MFFCCQVCAIQFRCLVERVKQETGWHQVDSLTIEGDRRGRMCLATAGEQGFRARVVFNAEGQILRFERLSAS